MFKYISVVALGLFVSSCDEAPVIVEFDNDRDTLSYQLIQSIKARDCFKIFAPMPITKTDFFAFDSILKAYFLEEGICTEANPEEALNTYLNTDVGFNDDYFKNARIGNLYYRGAGTPKDLEKANYYFKQAILDVGPLIIFFADEEAMAEVEYETDTNSPAYLSWGLSKFQLETIFTIEEVGPWDLPQPLLDQIEWVHNLYEGDGSEILKLAHQLHDGTGGFDKNIDYALGWLSIITGPNNPSENTELYLAWLEEGHIEDESLFQDVLKDLCIDFQDMGYETEDECLSSFGQE